MTEREQQNALFAQHAAKAILQPGYRKAILDYPEYLLEGLAKEFQDALLKALKFDKIEETPVKDLATLFGANRWGAGGSVL